MPNSETYPQASIDKLTEEKSYLQELHDWHSNVNKTYNLALIPQTDADGEDSFLHQAVLQEKVDLHITLSGELITQMQ